MSSILDNGASKSEPGLRDMVGLILSSMRNSKEDNERELKTQLTADIGPGDFRVESSWPASGDLKSCVCILRHHPAPKHGAIGAFDDTEDENGKPYENANKEADPLTKLLAPENDLVLSKPVRLQQVSSSLGPCCVSISFKSLVDIQHLSWKTNARIVEVKIDDRYFQTLSCRSREARKMPMELNEFCLNECQKVAVLKKIELKLLSVSESLSPPLALLVDINIAGHISPIIPRNESIRNQPANGVPAIALSLGSEHENERGSLEELKQHMLRVNERVDRMEASLSRIERKLDKVLSQCM